LGQPDTLPRSQLSNGLSKMEDRSKYLNEMQDLFDLTVRAQDGA
jgi:hypothetical protein